MKFTVLGSAEITLNLSKSLKQTKHELLSLVSLNKTNLPNNPANIGKIQRPKDFPTVT